MSGIASCVVFTSYHVPHMSKSYQPLTCSSDITLSLPSYTGSALKRERAKLTVILVCYIFVPGCVLLLQTLDYGHPMRCFLNILGQIGQIDQIGFVVF